MDGLTVTSNLTCRSTCRSRLSSHAFRIMGILGYSCPTCRLSDRPPFWHLEVGDQEPEKSAKSGSPTYGPPRPPDPLLRTTGRDHEPRIARGARDVHDRALGAICPADPPGSGHRELPLAHRRGPDHRAGRSRR